MIKNIFIYTLIGFSSISCKGQKTMGAFFRILPAIEVVYKDSSKKETLITDKKKAAKITELLNTAQKSPAKFITKEEIILKDVDGKTTIIKKNNEFLMIEGTTFILNKKKSKEFLQLIQ